MNSIARIEGQSGCKDNKARTRVRPGGLFLFLGCGLFTWSRPARHKSIGSTVQYIAVSDQQAAQAAKRADAQMF
jgi:hypothetical protein